LYPESLVLGDALAGMLRTLHIICPIIPLASLADKVKQGK